jgi:hypothetical protein
MDRDKTEEVIVTKADEDAIRDIKLQFNEAWDRHDADGMVESLADMLSSSPSTAHGLRPALTSGT